VSAKRLRRVLLLRKANDEYRLDLVIRKALFPERVSLPSGLIVSSCAGRNIQLIGAALRLIRLLNSKVMRSQLNFWG